MKIAITAGSADPQSPVDIRFGRAAGFLVCDLETGARELHGNEQNLQAAQGAGIQSAQNVARLGVQAVISGHCGPKAFRVLTAAGIGIYCLNDSLSVEQALKKFTAGELTAAASADVEGHWV